DRLLEDFWPDRSGSARRNLSVALSRLRRHLQDGFDGDPILRSPNGYVLNEELGYRHDYREVLSLLERVLSKSGEELLSIGRRLAELYRGPYLEGCYLEWAVRRRTDLEDKL